VHRRPGAGHRGIVGNAVGQGIAADLEAVANGLRGGGSVDHKLHLARADGVHAVRAAFEHFVDEETEKESTYQIVGVHEADIKLGRLSVSSPLATALIGKKAGDLVSVPAPGGDRSYEILDVRFGN
jgi:hypothetical protein